MVVPGAGVTPPAAAPATVSATRPAPWPEPAALLLEPGRPGPPGAHWDGQGLHIAVSSTDAQAIELCLFDASGQVETHRGVLPGCTQDLWHGYLRAVPGSPLGRPGQLYGLRAHGPRRPDRGQRFNPRKLLVDPYAREIVGQFDASPEHFGHDGNYPLQPDPRDNAATALKARVVHDSFDWGDDPPLRTPLADTVLLEVHVKGYTKLHPGVPAPLQGTFAGLAQPAVVEHLRQLGITAVSLLPVQHALDEPRLLAMGLRNYWGYNTLGFFSTSPRLAANPDDIYALLVFGLAVRKCPTKPTVNQTLYGAFGAGCSAKSPDSLAFPLFVLYAATGFHLSVNCSPAALIAAAAMSSQLHVKRL